MEYRLYTLDRDSRIQARRDFVACDDASAMAMVAQLDLGVFGGELWERARVVARFPGRTA